MKELNFVKIIDCYGVSNEKVLKTNATCDLHPFFYETCVINRGGYIIFDFGKEICGRLHIKFGWADNLGKVRVRLGESVAETCAEIGENNAGNYHSLRDNEYNAVAWGEISTSESGFRFARIDVVGEYPAHIDFVFAAECENGLSAKGEFRCSDERLNSIYNVAARTLSLCVREKDIWDGIKRDRVFWTGDFYPELIGAYSVYGNVPHFERALRSIKQFEGRWVNNIPAYSAWWIVCLEKYYELSADETFLKEMLPYLGKIVNDFSVIVEASGKVSYEKSDLQYFGGNEFFLDWPTHGTEDSEIGWRYLLIYAMRQAEKIYDLFGEKNETVKELLKRLNKYDFRPSNFKQITAFGVLAGKIEKDKAAEHLKRNGAEGMTCFTGFAIIEALKAIGEGDYALELIKEYYGAMLDLGATTFWEDFDIEWLKDNPLPLSALPEEGRKNIHADYGKFCYKGLRHSLCHGWSSGFLEFLYDYVLGIKPLCAGFKKIEVEPHLCGMNYAEGRILTPFGIIEVKHSVKEGKVKTEITVPKGIEVKGL